jgi:hypothetical protein
MKKIVHNFYNTEDIKQIVKDVITEEGVAKKTDIIEFKDTILAEIQKMRDELAIIIGYKGQIEDHETRIEKIEEIAFPQ